MLTLSRKKQESIVIGDGIIVTVVDIRGGSCRIGIAAPIEVGVHRQEVWDAMQRDKQDQGPA